MVGNRKRIQEVKLVQNLTRSCVACKRISAKPQTEMMDQLPIKRVTPGHVFDQIGIDYAGPLQIKYGYVRKPTVIKVYVCVIP